jgi:hypothetical protein
MSWYVSQYSASVSATRGVESVRGMGHLQHRTARAHIVAVDKFPDSNVAQRIVGGFQRCANGGQRGTQQTDHALKLALARGLIGRPDERIEQFHCIGYADAGFGCIDPVDFGGEACGGGHDRFFVVFCHEMRPLVRGARIARDAEGGQ